jgi:long-subunit fatty acid transport protein
MTRPAFLIIAAVFLALSTQNAQAQSTAGAQSLLITPGARADAMGRAYVAVADDATATWWNPAALAFLEGDHFGAMNAQLVPGLADV